MPVAQIRKSNATRELRRARRKRSLLGGKIVSPDGAQSFNCVVRDLSDTGARIDVPPSTVFPSRIFLLTPRHALAHEAQLVWRNARQAGLKFVAAHALGPDRPSALRHLWCLYLEMCPRP